MDATIQYFERKVSAMKQERSSFIPAWMELSEYGSPRSSRWMTSDRNKGDQRNGKIINDSVVYSRGVLASGLHSGLTSPARPWMQLRTSDPELNKVKSVKIWLDDARQRMLDVFQRSNLYHALPNAYRDLGLYGTAAFEVLEDEETTIRCYSAPIGSFCLGTSFRGAVDSFSREFQMSTSQLVKRFGEENCSSAVRSAFANKTGADAWVDVVHVVEANPDHDPKSPWAKHKEFREVYYEKGQNDGKFLYETGHDEFPIMAARWSITGEDTYATDCPGMQSLGNNKMLQLGEQRGWEAIAKVVRPPTFSPVALRNSVVSTLPGGNTFVDTTGGQQPIKPIYQIDPHIEAMDRKLQRLELQIERAFHVDLFMMISSMERNQITATEITARQQEKMLALGPVLERLNDELFDPLIKRVFGIMSRRGMLPDMPPEMQGAKLTIEYVSVLAQAQKLIGVQALEKLTNYIMTLLQAFPSAGDKFDFDNAIDEYAAMVGAGPRTTRDAKEANGIRTARNEAAQAQQSMQMAQQGAQTAQTLGQTPITDDTALGAMLARMSGGTAA